MKTLFAIVLAAMVWPLSAIGEEDGALVTFKALKLEVALKLAQTSLEACREGGFQVAVAVVDRFGNIQVLLRDQLAGAHAAETARRKAWTAATLKADTKAVTLATAPGTELFGAHWVEGAIMVAGAIPVYAAGALVGAVGISGSPNGDDDQECAEKGIEAIEEDLMF